MERELHPSVSEFKEFVKRHPLIIKEVREGKKTWNTVYQDWVILGEEDESWTAYKKNPDDTASNTTTGLGVSGDLLPTLLQSLNQVNIADLQKNLSQFSGVMGNIQRLMNQFQSNRQQRPPERGPEDPFSFRGF